MSRIHRSSLDSSDWWFYFEKAAGGEMALCRECGWAKPRGRSKSTHILKYHLEHAHPELYQQKLAAERIKFPEGRSMRAKQSPKVEFAEFDDQHMCFENGESSTLNFATDDHDATLYNGENEEGIKFEPNNELEVCEDGQDYYYYSPGTGMTAEDGSVQQSVDNVEHSFQESFRQQQHEQEARAERKLRMEVLRMKKQCMQYKIQAAKLAMENELLINKRLKTHQTLNRVEKEGQQKQENIGAIEIRKGLLPMQRKIALAGMEDETAN